MDKEQYERIDKTFAAFNFSTIQSFTTLFVLMDRDSITRDDILEYKKLKIGMLKTVREKIIKCSDCLGPMRVEYVNLTPSTQTGDGSKMVYTCVNSACKHQIFE